MTKMSTAILKRLIELVINNLQNDGDLKKICPIFSLILTENEKRLQISVELSMLNFI